MTVPYLLLVSTTNRTQLIIFLIMILVFALKLLRKKYNLNFIFMYVFLFTTIIYFFKVEILEWLLKFFENNAMAYRINQLLIIFKEGIDYKSPYLLSVTQRIVEAELVINYWTTDVLSFIFGAGSGGTIDGSKIFKDTGVLNTALLGSKKIHNIHLFLPNFYPTNTPRSFCWLVLVDRNSPRRAKFKFNFDIRGCTICISTRKGNYDVYWVI